MFIGQISDNGMTCNHHMKTQLMSSSCMWFQLYLSTGLIIEIAMFKDRGLGQGGFEIQMVLLFFVVRKWSTDIAPESDR